jgi:hypothetical protein
MSKAWGVATTSTPQEPEAKTLPLVPAQVNSPSRMAIHQRLYRSEEGRDSAGGVKYPDYFNFVFLGLVENNVGIRDKAPQRRRKVVPGKGID